MDHAYQANVSQTKPAFSGYQTGYPQPASPSSPATIPGPAWYYMVTEELRNLVLAGGVVPDAFTTNQVSQAITAMASQAATQAVAPFSNQISNAVAIAQAAVSAAAAANSAVSPLASQTGASLVGWQSPGLGAVTRTIQAKLQERVSVLDFGAVADGNFTTGYGSDNSPAFQAAINAMASTGGGVVYVPGGTSGIAYSSYKLASQITVPDGVSIVGAGRWSSIVFCPSLFSNTSGLIRVNGTTGYPTCISNLGVLAQQGGCAGYGIVSVKNGTFLSGLWANGFNTGIQLDNTDNFLFDFAVEYCQNGVYLTSKNCNVSHGVVFSCSQGVLASNASVADAGYLVISGVRAGQCLRTGFALSTAKQVQILGCSAAHVNADEFTFAGILADTCSDIVIDGFGGHLGAPSPTGFGIQLTNSTDVVVSNPKLTGWLDGINVSGGNVTITGGETSANGRNGAFLSGCGRAKVSGLDAFGNGLAGFGSGIDVRNSAAYAMVSIVGNTCSQNGGGTQNYGIYADVSSPTAMTLVEANICRYNAIADISATTIPQNIVAKGNIPEGAVGSASTVVLTAANYTLSYAEESVIANGSGTLTLTLPPAATNIGRQVQVRTTTANAVVSAASNIVPLVGGAATTAIVPATSGKWASLRSDGVNWQIMASN